MFAKQKKNLGHLSKYPYLNKYSNSNVSVPVQLYRYTVNYRYWYCFI
jgi:hypothetical protein